MKTNFNFTMVRLACWKSLFKYGKQQQ